MEEVVGSIPTRSTNNYHNVVIYLENAINCWTKFGQEWQSGFYNSCSWRTRRISNLQILERPGTASLHLGPRVLSRGPFSDQLRFADKPVISLLSTLCVLFSRRHLRRQEDETRCSGQFTPARDQRPVIERAADSARDAACRDPVGRGCGFCSFPSQAGVCREASAAHADPVEVSQPDRSHHDLYCVSHGRVGGSQT